MCLCNVLFLIKYKTHVFSVFRIFREQKYKHMIFELKLVFEVQKYKFFRQFLGKIMHFWVKTKPWVRLRKLFSSLVKLN